MQGTYHSRTVKPEEDLSNQFSLGVNSYSYYLADVTNMIISY